MGWKSRTNTLAQRVLPLALRKRCAVWLDRQTLLSSGKWWAVQLIQDLAERDVDAYHRFLWEHHLGYAETYRVEDRFGKSRIHQTRKMLFADLERWYAEQGAGFKADVRSVFEVGCSLGYLLRYLETDVLEAPERLAGVDIDRHAIVQGAAYLRDQGSRVALEAADMDELARVLAGQHFDLFLCCGVLMYTRAEQATEIVRTMLEHGRTVAISGLAHSDVDNRMLDAAVVRERDGTLVHNIDAIVEAAGGQVLWRRWEGPKLVDGNTIYFLICRGQP
jgi:SAM-dependent methyltransferase